MCTSSRSTFHPGHAPATPTARTPAAAASISSLMLPSPRSIAARSSVEISPTPASIRACAIDPRMSAAYSLVSYDSDSTNRAARGSVAEPSPDLACSQGLGVLMARDYAREVDSAREAQTRRTCSGSSSGFRRHNEVTSRHSRAADWEGLQTAVPAWQSRPRGSLPRSTPGSTVSGRLQPSARAARSTSSACRHR